MCCSHSTAQIVVMFFNFITGLCLAVVSFVLTLIPTTTELNLSLRYVFRLFPSFCLGDGILQLALCTDGVSCPTINKDGYNFDGSQDPLAWDIAGADLVFLGAHAIIYFALAVLIGAFTLLSAAIFLPRSHNHAAWRSLRTEYGLTFPALLAWLYDVEDEETDIHERLLGAHSTVDGEGGGGGKREAGERLLQAGGAAGAAQLEEDEDVHAERVRVMGGGADGEVVRIQQLRKIYPANSKQGGLDPLVCFRVAWRQLGRAVASLLGADEGEQLASRNKQAAAGQQQKRYKVAVQSLCFGIPKGQCFGFLGKCLSC